MARTKAGSSVLDMITEVGGNQLDGAAFSAAISMSATKIFNLLDPVQDQDAATRMYVDDQITNVIVPLLNSLVPAGTVMGWGNTAPPADWVVCDGTSYLSATYPTLFSTIGTTYGVGANDFRVPDLRGRKILGHYSGGPATNRVTSVDAQTIGDLGGDDGFSSPMTSAELPIHNHTGSSSPKFNHKHAGTTGDGGTHTHSIHARDHGVDRSGSSNLSSTVIRNGQPLKNNIIQSVPNHSHTVTGINTEPNHFHTFTTANSGGTDGHENIPPFQTVNYIIKVV